MRTVKLDRDSKRDLLANLLKRSTTQYPEYEAKVAAIVATRESRFSWNATPFSRSRR